MLSTDAVNDTSKWFDRDFTKEIHRDMDDVDPMRAEEEEEKIKVIVNVQPRKWTRLTKLIDTFENWNFNVHTYYDILEEKALLHFGFKLFGTGLLLEKFSIPDNNFTQLLTMI